MLTKEARDFFKKGDAAKARANKKFKDVYREAISNGLDHTAARKLGDKAAIDYMNNWRRKMGIIVQKVG